MSLGQKIIKARNKSTILLLGMFGLIFLEYYFLISIIGEFALWLMLITFIVAIFLSHKIAEPLIIEGANLYEQRMDADIRNND